MTGPARRIRPPSPRRAALPPRTAAEDRSAAGTLRVSTYNIHKGVLREFIGFAAAHPQLHRLGRQRRMALPAGARMHQVPGRQPLHPALHHPRDPVELLDWLGLTAVNRQYRRLSGGEQQRVKLAAALI